jgi:phenylacetate-CoA ligase
LNVRYSSGSTGLRVAVKQDRDFDMWCRAHQLRTYSWGGGWRLGDPFVLVWGAPMLFEGRSHAQLMDNRLSRRLERNSFRLDRGSLDRTLDVLVRFRPRLISGYTTALYLLAQRALERGVELDSLVAVQTTAEPLPPAMRATIAAGLAREVFDKHGSRESSIVAHESPAHAGMCIQAEHTYVEFLDAHGATCRPGQLGRLVLTTQQHGPAPAAIRDHRLGLSAGRKLPLRDWAAPNEPGLRSPPRRHLHPQRRACASTAVL